MAGTAGKELQTQLQKACEGINTHPKFKSAYYFSLQPLETLCDPSTGRCSQNALYALTHGCVAKIMIGLQQFPEDERVSTACMKIFEVMCDAANGEELQQFFDQGGVQGVLNWAAEANAKVSQDAFNKALKILVALAKFEVTAAVPILVTKLKTQDDIAVSQTIANAIIKIADNYTGCQLEGLPGLITYLLHLSGRTTTTKAFTQLVDSAFKSLRAVAAKSHDAGEYVLQLLELKDRYADDAATEVYLMPLLNSLCSREDAAAALQTMKSAPDTPNLGVLLYRAAYCPELADIVKEMKACPDLIGILRTRTKLVANSAQPISEDAVHLISSCCQILCSLRVEPDAMAEIEKLNTLEVAVALVNSAGAYPQIISAANELIAPQLTKESNAMTYMKNGGLATALNRLNEASEIYSSRMLLSLCPIIKELSKNPSCCSLFREQKVIPKICSALKESTYNSSIAFLLLALRTYVNKCDPMYLDESNLLNLIDCSIGQHHISEHIISETANLIEAMSQASGSAFDSNLSAKLIFKCLDCVPSIESICFADCVGALRSIKNVERYVDETANTCFTISQKISTKASEARFPFMRLGALCSVDQEISKRPIISKLSSALPQCIEELTRNSKIDSSTREALVTTLVYLIQAVNDPIESLGMMFEIAMKINSTQDPEALARVIDMIQARVGYFDPSAKDERNLPSTQLMSGLLSTAVIQRLVTLTRKLLQQHGDSRPGSVASLELLDAIMNLNKPEGSVIALAQKLQAEVINIGKRLKMWSEVQLAVFITLENMLKFATEEQLKATKELGIVQIIKSAEANHCRNKPLRKQIFRVSVLVLQSDYLEEVIRSLIQKCEADLTLATTKNTDEFTEVADDFDQLIYPLSENDGIRIAIRHKLMATLLRTANIMDDPKFRLSAQACVTTLTQLLQHIGKSTTVSQQLLEREYAVKLTTIASHIMTSNPQSSSIYQLLLTAGHIINFNTNEAEKCLAFAPSIMTWLAANNYAQACYETIAAWLARMPVLTLVDSQDFKVIIAALVKATESDDVAVVTSALRAIQQFDQSELFPILRDMGVERAIYVALHRMGPRSSFVLNESITILDRFSAELAQELPERSTVLRARILARVLAIATSDVTVIRAFDILGRLVLSCPNKTWFKGETSLIKSVRWAQAKLGARTSEVEDSMNAILSMMGGEEMALMLMSQLLDDINKAKNDKKNLPEAVVRLSGDFTDIAPYLSGVFDKPQRLFQGLGECFEAIKPILKDFPADTQLREGVYLCASRALDSALMLKNDSASSQLMGTIIKDNLGVDLTSVLTASTIGPNGMKLIARMCACQTTSSWAMAALKNGGLINECFRALKAQSSTQEVRKSLEFMTALGSHIEGFHMLQRSFKTLYGSNTDFWKQQAEAAATYTEDSLGNAMPYLFNFPSYADNCAEQIVGNLAILKKLGSSNIVTSMWATAICVKATNFVAPDMLKKQIGSILEFCKSAFSELDKLISLQNMTPQEMSEVLEPLAKTVSYTTAGSDLDETNDLAINALSKILRAVDMRSQFWKVVLPSLIESVGNSKFCAERVVRCIYPIIQEQLRFFKGAQSVIRDDGLRLIAACSMYIPIPDHQEFLKALGETSDIDTRANVKPLELARSDMLRERNTGVEMHSESSEIIRKNLPLLRSTLDKLAPTPLNPDDSAASDLLTALECLSLFRDEKTENFTSIFQALLINQSNPVILSSVIRTLSDLKLKAPMTVKNVFTSMEGSNLVKVVSELVKGMDACSGDEKIERLTLFANYVPPTVFELTPLFDSCVKLYTESANVREKRYALLAINASLAASPKVTETTTSQIIPLVISSLGDQRLRQNAVELYDTCLKALPEFDKKLQANPEWHKLSADPDLMPLLTRSPISREALLNGGSDDRLKVLVENVPTTAGILADLCKSDTRFVTKIQQMYRTAAGSDSIENFVQGKSLTLKEDPSSVMESDLLLLLTYLGEPAAISKPVDQAFRTLASGKGDYQLLQVCCRTLNSPERARWLIQTLDWPLWSKNRVEILTALMSSPEVPADLNKEAVERCRRDSSCQKVIFNQSHTVLDPPLLCEMLGATDDPELSRNILEKLQDQDWAKYSIAPTLIRVLQRTTNEEVSETLVKAILAQLKRYSINSTIALTTTDDADWDDEPVPSEGFLPLSYAIERPTKRRAWQILDLSDALCQSLISSLLKYLGKKPALDDQILELLAYFACEKPVGMESVWYVNDFFRKATAFLRVTPVSANNVLAISTAACNIAAVSDEAEFLQLKNNTTFWSALELALDAATAQKNNDWKVLVAPVLKAAHDAKSTQIDFLRRSRFDWFDISLSGH